MRSARDIYGSKWSEKEYLIVLNSYFEHRGEAQHADTPFVQELSKVLGRTPHSILYRLQNFASIDPDEKNPRRKGKIHITEFGQRIFECWSKKLDTLKDTASVILRDEKHQQQPDLFNPDPIRLPITFNNYELLDEIGRGGFGIVFSCLNTKDQNPYAIKVIDASQLGQDEHVHRFAREIKALKSIRHPSVIHIYEDNLDNERGYPGFVMDLAEIDLPKYINIKAKEIGCPAGRPILDFNEACSIFNSIAKAVQALHDSMPTVLHRDINPNNILRLFNGQWVLADFSLAKFLPPAPVSTTFATATNIGGMGTAHYVAPEQYESLKKADAYSDIFSLGWLLWDLFSSEGPFPRREPSGLSAELEKVFLKATNFNHEDRFRNVKELHDATKASWKLI